MRAGELRRIIEWPMQSGGNARENRATFRLGFAANRHYKLERLAGFQNIEHALGGVLRDVDSEFLERFDNDRIDRAWLQTGTLCFKDFATGFVQ